MRRNKCKGREIGGIRACSGLGMFSRNIVGTIASEGYTVCMCGVCRMYGLGRDMKLRWPFCEEINGERFFMIIWENWEWGKVEKCR